MKVKDFPSPLVSDDVISYLPRGPKTRYAIRDDKIDVVRRILGFMRHGMVVAPPP